MHTSTHHAAAPVGGSDLDSGRAGWGWRAGSPSAPEDFAEFCVQVRPRLHSYLMRRTASAEDARDVCQEVLTRAWARWDTVSKLDEPAAWTFTVANNILTDAWRRDRRRQAAAVVAPRGTDSHRVDRADILAVREAVLDLPQDVRDAVLLYYFHDWTLQRIATVAGVPPKTVKHRLHRGRRVLRARLDDSDLTLSAAG